MQDQPTQLDAIVVHALRDAGKPVREAALFERVRSRGGTDEPELFLAALEHLATLGNVHVMFDHDIDHEPHPFQPRVWRATD